MEESDDEKNEYEAVDGDQEQLMDADADANIDDVIIDDEDEEDDDDDEIEDDLPSSELKDISKQSNDDKVLDLELEDNEDEFYNYAFIDSYKTSVFMNNIFRNIKENKDLDKIEESDSEDEFENISLDKYLKNKSCHILCEYNYKFSKWIPVKLMDESSTIVSKNELSRI